MIHVCGNAMEIEKRNFHLRCGTRTYVLSSNRLKGYSSFVENGYLEMGLCRPSVIFATNNSLGNCKFSRRKFFIFNFRKLKLLPFEFEKLKI